MSKKRKIRIAVLGCGERARTVVGHLLKDSDRQVEVAAIFDPEPVWKNSIAEGRFQNTAEQRATRRKRICTK